MDRNVHACVCMQACECVHECMGAWICQDSKKSPINAKPKALPIPIAGLGLSLTSELPLFRTLRFKPLHMHYQCWDVGLAAQSVDICKQPRDLLPSLVPELEESEQALRTCLLLACSPSR